MSSLSDKDLLREYVEHRSEPAFTELVQRHVDLVYSSALRIVREPHLAEDVTQSVFSALAESAGNLVRHPVLAGWLHRTTHHLASNVVRQEVRRRAWEQESATMNELVASEDAWEEIEPHIEEALSRLRNRDRDLVLLRFFQGKSAREIAAIIGTSEEAAQKRLNRAVEQLRRFLAGRSIAVGYATLGVSLSVHAVKAAPLGLADAISKGIVQTALNHAATITVAKGAVMTTTQKAVVAASLAVAVATGVYEIQKTGERHRQTLQSEQTLSELDLQFQGLRREHAASLQEILSLRAAVERMRKEAAEVHRLRGEVTQLRADALKAQPTGQESGLKPTEAALISWLNRTDAFIQAQYCMPEKAIPELALLTEEDWLEMAKKHERDVGENPETEDPEVNRKMLKIARAKAKMKFGFLLSTALHGFREAHDDQLPSEISLLLPYFEDRAPHLGGSAEFVNDAMLRRYEVVQTGKFADVPAGEVVILAEIAPTDKDFDTRLVVGKHWLHTAGENHAAYWPNEAALVAGE